jgi:hypothetical protein
MTKIVGGRHESKLKMKAELEMRDAARLPSSSERMGVNANPVTEKVICLMLEQSTPTQQSTWRAPTGNAD